MKFICKKSMKVQRKGQIVQLKPGDEVPEAASWTNVKRYVDLGRIEVVDGSVPELQLNKPQMRKSTEEDAKRGENNVTEKQKISFAKDDKKYSEDLKFLESLTRTELNKCARERGCEDPESFKTKGDLIKAVVVDKDAARKLESNG